jgi:hypothetical protein
MEHERDVLQQQPTRAAAAAVDEAKDVADEARLAPADARCPSRLTQVLAREPCGDELSITETPQRSHVVPERHVSKSCSKDAGGAGLVLAKERRVVARLLKTDFDAPDASEQAGYGQPVSSLPFCHGHP